MPKTSKDFPETINVGIPGELKDQLQAVGYFTGNGGAYAGVVRNWLAQSYKAFLRNLPPDQVSEFEQILKNVKTRNGTG